jgi:branched-chain amino acid transport system substrate-binding protein
MQVLAVEYFPNGATDVSAALTKIRDLKADLILGSVHLSEGVAIIKQGQELGVNPGGGFGETVAPPTPDFVKTLGPAAEYVIGSTQWTPESPGKDPYFGTAKDYAEGVKKAFNHEPEYHNAEATAACLALVLAVQKAGTTDVIKVRESLATLDTDSFFGPIKFDSTGKNVTKAMGVIQIQEGKTVTVWPKAEGTKPLKWPTPPFDKR